MAKYRCRSCNYPFNSNEYASRCPYCGKKGAVEEEPSAEKLVDEVNKMIADGTA